ncbi:hypothetical protein ABE10_01775, partial [Bacillus toyonensis]|nr:hypothetical protein [Bacillus toyonensis]
AEPLGRIVSCLGERSGHMSGDDVHRVIEEGDEHRLLVLEVVIERGHGDADVARDGTDRRRVETAVDDLTQGDGQHGMESRGRIVAPV